MNKFLIIEELWRRLEQVCEADRHNQAAKMELVGQTIKRGLIGNLWLKLKKMSSDRSIQDWRRSEARALQREGTREGRDESFGSRRWGSLLLCYSSKRFHHYLKGWRYLTRRRKKVGHTLKWNGGSRHVAAWKSQIRRQRGRIITAERVEGGGSFDRKYSHPSSAKQLSRS